MSLKLISFSLSGIFIFLMVWISWQVFETEALSKQLANQNQTTEPFEVIDHLGVPSEKEIVNDPDWESDWNIVNISLTTAMVQGLYRKESGRTVPAKIHFFRDVNTGWKWRVEKVELNLFTEISNAGLRAPSLDQIFKSDHAFLDKIMLPKIKKLCPHLSGQIKSDHIQLKKRQLRNTRRQIVTSYSATLKAGKVKMELVSKWRYQKSWDHDDLKIVCPPKKAHSPE